jgi:hypothetical protein
LEISDSVECKKDLYGWNRGGLGVIFKVLDLGVFFMVLKFLLEIRLDIGKILFIFQDNNLIFLEYIYL